MSAKSIIYSLVCGAALAVPSISFAKMNLTPGRIEPSRAPYNEQMPYTSNREPEFGPTSDGSGMVGGDPSHVASPGRTPIDNDSRGPIDDVDVASPTNSNNHATVTPKPVR